LYYFLFIIYLTSILYFIPRIAFIKNAGLKSSRIRTLFLLKVLVGVTWGFLNSTLADGTSDILAYNFWGWEEYQVLVNDPKAFLTNLFYANYPGYNNFFGSAGSFWNDLEANIIAKFLAPLNIISRGNYYINSLFFNFFCFFGHIAIYKIFAHIYKDKKIAVLIGCFLLPSTLLFTSGIGKDNVIFTLFCLFSYCIYFSLQNKFTVKRTLLALLCFTGILLIRNYVALLLIPPLLAMAMAHKLTLSPVKIFAGVYLLVLLVLASLSLSTSINPAEVIAQKQKDFLAIPAARTQLPMDTLLPNTGSLIKNLPQAINHGLLRPYIWESKNVFDFLLALELLFYILLFVFLIATLKKTSQRPPPFVLFAFAVSLSVWLLNGYIVPNFNSLVRYRSIFLPFLLTPVLCHLITFWKHKKYITF
jgi:hypothetical protein